MKKKQNKRKSKVLTKPNEKRTNFCPKWKKEQQSIWTQIRKKKIRKRKMLKRKMNQKWWSVHFARRKWTKATLVRVLLEISDMYNAPKFTSTPALKPSNLKRLLSRTANFQLSLKKRRNKLSSYPTKRQLKYLRAQNSLSLKS